MKGIQRGGTCWLLLRMALRGCCCCCWTYQVCNSWILRPPRCDKTHGSWIWSIRGVWWWCSGIQRRDCRWHKSWGAAARRRRGACSLLLLWLRHCNVQSIRRTASPYSGRCLCSGSACSLIPATSTRHAWPIQSRFWHSSFPVIELLFYELYHLN